MPFATFSEDLRLGHEQIDRQHASLFETVNLLHDAMRAGNSRQELGRILGFLRDYTVKHFQTEEAFMRDTGYPDMEAHLAEHASLVQQVRDLEEKHAAGSMTISLTVMTFLKDWLEHHIGEVDRKLVGHLRGV
jgi:hemerythrin-like metal-binding protein